MKHILSYIIGLSIISSFFIIHSSHAIDACNSFQPQTVSGLRANINSGVNIRSFPCTTKSQIIGTAKVGESYNITRKVDGYYEIELSNGSKGWVWDGVVSTSKVSGYIITQKDRDFIKKADTIIRQAVKKDWSIRGSLIRKINKILPSIKKDSRNEVLLKELLKITESIQAETVEVENKSPTIPSTPTNSISENSTIDSTSNISYTSAKIDIEKLRNTWLSWYNEYRKSQNLKNYSYDTRLQKTAEEWTELAKKRGYISHERTPGDGFYNYPIIEKWFQARGVKCKVSGRSTSVENTGYYSYRCNDSDCTEEASSALRKTFDFYLSEKSYNGAHYRSIVSPYLQYMGLGVSIVDNGGGSYKMYNTTHFCTEFE